MARSELDPVVGVVDEHPSRIECVETYVLEVPLARPIADSHARLTHWVVPVVEVSTADGLTGTGCSGVHTGGDLLVNAIDRYLAPALMGKPAVSPRFLWHEMYAGPLQWIGRSGVVHMAISMLDIALWDLAAQRAGMPLWQLLGGHQGELPAYNTDAGWLNRSTDEMVDDMLALIRTGWSAVKMKLGKPRWQEDIDRVDAVRSALGPEVWLAADVNKQWDMSTATRVLPALESANIAWIEEPFHPDDVNLHSRLQALTRIPVAAGESLYSRHSFQTFFELHGLNVAQVDVTRVGGVTEYLEIAAAANAAGIPVVPHAGDMVQIHQHLVAASFSIANPAVEYLPWATEIYDDPVQVRRGKVIVSRRPGAATRIRRDARAHLAVPGVGAITRS